MLAKMRDYSFSAFLLSCLLSGTLLFIFDFLEEADAARVNAYDTHLSNYPDPHAFCREYTQEPRSQALAIKDEVLWVTVVCTEFRDTLALPEIRQHVALGISNVDGYTLTYNAIVRVENTIDSLCNGDRTLALVYDIRDGIVMRAAPICENEEGLTLRGAIGSGTEDAVSIRWDNFTSTD